MDKEHFKALKIGSIGVIGAFISFFIITIAFFLNQKWLGWIAVVMLIISMGLGFFGIISGWINGILKLFGVRKDRP